MASYSSARPSAKEGLPKYPTESEQSYRKEGSALPPFFKAKPGTHETALPLNEIAQQDNTQKDERTRAFGGVGELPRINPALRPQ